MASDHLLCFEEVLTPPVGRLGCRLASARRQRAAYRTAEHKATAPVERA